MPETALIIEDHPLFRAALIHPVRATLPDVEPIAASNAEAGLKLASTLSNIRLILLDPGLPGMNGAEAIAALSRACPAVELIAVSASEDRCDAITSERQGQGRIILAVSKYSVPGLDS